MIKYDPYEHAGNQTDEIVIVDTAMELEVLYELKNTGDTFYRGSPRSQRRQHKTTKRLKKRNLHKQK